jgi:hypothetical protein
MKITASQLKAIIKEEVQNVRIEKMIRESVREALLEASLQDETGTWTPEAIAKFKSLADKLEPSAKDWVYNNIINVRAGGKARTKEDMMKALSMAPKQMKPLLKPFNDALVKMDVELSDEEKEAASDIQSKRDATRGKQERLAHAALGRDADLSNLSKSQLKKLAGPEKAYLASNAPR